MKKILVVAAHPDDELLGCAGTIRRLVDRGCEARAIIMAEGISSRYEKRDEASSDELDKLKKNSLSAANIVGYDSIDFCNFPDNRMDEISLLDVIKKISSYIDQYKPDTIFTHHHGDLNIDHRITCEAVLTACRPVADNTVNSILAFETPSSTEWNYCYEQPFMPNIYFDISKTIDAKVNGMNCYDSEKRDFPHPRSAEALKSLAKYRGSNAGYEFAEAFMLLRGCYSDQDIKI